jgi:hypothetical protein
MINRIAFENELFSYCQSRLPPPPGGRMHVAAKIAGSERDGSSCRSTQRERV